MPGCNRRDLLGMAGAAVLQRVDGAAGTGAQPRESIEQRKGLHFGTALGGRGLADNRLLAIIRAQCGVIVPENALRMGAAQPEPAELHSARAEALLALTDETKIAIRAQQLRWPHPRCSARWI